MRNIADVLAEKEKELVRVRCEVEALKMVIPLLDDGNPPPGGQASSPPPTPPSSKKQWP